MKSLGSCYICLAPSSQKCSGCQAVHYCSREHQKQHWKQHKHQCTPVRVKEDETVGRYLEASRDIKAGDIVMKEKALITGPAQVGNLLLDVFSEGWKIFQCILRFITPAFRRSL